MGPLVPPTGGLLPGPPCRDLTGAPGPALPRGPYPLTQQNKSLSADARLLKEGNSFALFPEHTETSKSLA